MQVNNEQIFQVRGQLELLFKGISDQTAFPECRKALLHWSLGISLLSSESLQIGNFSQPSKESTLLSFCSVVIYK